MEQSAATNGPWGKGPWPDPTSEMLADPTFNTIWEVIKSWDINVPAAYEGYSGASGNHVRAILEALRAAQPSSAALGYQHVEIMGHQQVSGFVQPVAFGNAVLFRVTMPARPGHEYALDLGAWIENTFCGAGTRVRSDRTAVDVYLGASSVFRMTPTTEAEAIDRQPESTIEILALVTASKDGPF